MGWKRHRRHHTAMASDVLPQLSRVVLCSCTSKIGCDRLHKDATLVPSIFALCALEAMPYEMTDLINVSQTDLLLQTSEAGTLGGPSEIG